MFNSYLLLMSAFLAPLLGGSSTQIRFADANLEREVRSTLRLEAEETITHERIQKLVDLRAERRGIVSLSGLEHATQLRSLRLIGNRLTDISELESATMLRELDLRENQIEELSPISNLEKLSILVAGGNPITDITAIAGLKALVDLSYNRVADLSPLLGMTSLQQLDLRSNRLEREEIWSAMQSLLKNNSSLKLLHD